MTKSECFQAKNAIYKVIGQIESNIHAPVLYLTYCKKAIKYTASLAFCHFFPTHLINSIIHEH